MSEYGFKIRKELKQCAADMVSDCGLTATVIDGLKGKPAGPQTLDYVNPHYKGKITFEGNKIYIRLKVLLTGNLNRAKATMRNIKKVYATQNVLVEFTEVSRDHDLRIHGATLAELAVGLKSCTCEKMLDIGGWGPSYKNLVWGDALLVNPHTPRHYWEMVDAHEFGHKLGLRHRENLGMMDYWDVDLYKRDPRRFLATEKDRIRALYQ